MKREDYWLDGRCPDCKQEIDHKDADDRICPACELKEHARSENDWLRSPEGQNWELDRK